jgi:hypothetical protein
MLKIPSVTYKVQVLSHRKHTAALLMLLRVMAVVCGMQGFGMSQYVVCTFTVEL